MSAPQVLPQPLQGLRSRDPQDAEVGDPLAEMLAIEADGRWPSGLEAYRSSMRTLAEALDRQDEHVRWRLYTWLLVEAHALLQHRDELVRQARLDALQDVVFDGAWTARSLVASSERLQPQRRPNISSYMRARVLWRADDLLARQRRRYPCPAEREPNVWLRMVHATELGQLLAGYGLSPTEERALSMLGRGAAIAEAARRTGLSRQRIYRLLETLRAWAVRRPLSEEAA